MVSAIIKLDANWIRDTITVALMHRIAQQGMNIKQFELQGYRLSCGDIWIEIQCLAATKQGDEAEVHVDMQDIDQWLQEGVINRGYDPDHMITTPALRGDHSELENEAISNLVFEFKYKCASDLITQT